MSVSWHLALLSLGSTAPPYPGVNFDGVTIDDQTKARVVACRAMLLDCRREASSGRAKFEYIRESFRQEPPYVTAEYVGELAWRDATCKYVVYRKGVRDHFDYGAVMRDDACFIAKWGPSSFYIFEATRPKREYRDLMAVHQIEPVCVDPVMLWEIGLSSLWAPGKGAIVSSVADDEKIDISLEFKGPNGATTARAQCIVSSRTMLPSMFVSNRPIKGKWKKSLTCEREWQQFNGCWHPSVNRFTYHVAQRDGSVRDCPITVRLTEVSLNVPVEDREISPESLPLPEGLLGVDNRKSASMPIYFSKNGLTHEKPRNQQVVSTNLQNPNLNEDEEEANAQALRNRYYYRIGAIAAGVIAALTAAILTAVWRRRASAV